MALLVLKPWASPGDSSGTSGSVSVTTTAAPSDTTPATTSGDAANAGANPDPAGLTQGALSNYLNSEDSQITGLTADAMVQVADLSIHENLPSEWKNVLLLGVDQRTLEESARSDTMIICSINTTTGEVKLTSIMRDLAVDYDDIGQYNGTYRINAANFFGGPELAMKTINECFDMNIDSYVMVNFFGFQYIAEALGGVTLDITEEEMNHINKNAVRQAMMGAAAGIDESGLEQTNVLLEQYGENVHLNGRQTLAYARIRKIDSDFSRSGRQRKVLMALLEQAKGKSALELTTLAANLQQYFQTNLDLMQILNIATIVLNSDLNAVDELTLPVNGTYTQETRNNQSMFYDCDFATNALQLQNFIYYQ